MSSVARPLAGLLCLPLLTGCTQPRASAAADTGPCKRAAHVADLPSVLHESSGLAASRRHPGIVWTHNDSGDAPVVYALDTSGRLVGRVRVTGAAALDWEDIALGPCASGDCLYIGDIGDNDAVRGEVQVYRVPEPEPGDADTRPAERLTLTYPGGPRDAEALYVLPDTGIYIVSKGRREPVALYRVPRGWQPAASARLEHVQTLAPRASGPDEMVTGADATPDGSWVTIRTYAWLRFYRPGADGRLTPAFQGLGAPLEDAGEPQGEAVAFGRGDTIWLSSEAGPGGGRAAFDRIGCALPGRGGKGEPTGAGGAPAGPASTTGG